MAFVVGGTAPYPVLNALVDRLAGLVEYRPIAFGSEDGPLVSDMRRRGVDVELLGTTSLPSAGLAAARLTRTLRRLAPDLVHSNLFVPCLATELARIRLGDTMPSLLNRHHNLQHHYERKPLHVAIDAWCASHATAVAAVSEAVAQTIRRRERVRRTPLHVVHNGFDWNVVAADPAGVAAWRARYPDRRLLVAAGRLDAVKDLPTLLRAMEMIRREEKRAHLLVAGTGTAAMTASLELLVESLGLRQHVSFLGYVTQVFDLMSAADVFVQASVDEACSQTISEAAGLAVPLAVTTTGGTAELLEGLAHPELPAGRPDLLAARVLHLLHESGAARQEARTFAPRLRERLSADRMAESYLSVYRSLLEPPAATLGGLPQSV